MPTVSVVIPTYNRSAELGRALDALVAQTSKDFEVVVCDDGSQEDIAGVVARYAEPLRIRSLRIENSGGPARPRNVAVRAAAGAWISFLDSDDWWVADRMERVLPALVDDADVIYHPLVAVREAGDRRRIRRVGAPMGPDPLRHMLRHGNPIPNSAAIVRRSCLERIGGLAEDLNSVEDFDAWLRLAEAGARFRFIEEPLGYYALTAASISVFDRRQFEVQRSLFERHLALVPPGLRALADSSFSYLLGSYALVLGDRASALSYLARVRPEGGLARRLLAAFKYGCARARVPWPGRTGEKTR